jgi:nitroreductase
MSVIHGLDLIAARRSEPVLLAPGPTTADLHQMLTAATSAPDHRRQRPWRFYIIEGPARERLGETLASALAATRQQAGASITEHELAAERRKPLRAPTIVAIAAVRREGSVPPWEQLASAAAATQNLLLAATALGYGSMWRTGALLDDPCVKDAFCLAVDDRMIGLVFLGRAPTGPRPTRRKPPPHELILRWSGARRTDRWAPTDG